MGMKVIPSGSSAVMTDHKRGDMSVVMLMNAIKDAQAQLERSVGTDYADTVKTVKDSEANLHNAVADKFINTIQDVKDAEARLERGAGQKFIDTIQDIKDAETRLTANEGSHFIQTIQDVKDAETRLNSAAADRFIQTIQDVKDAEVRSERAAADRFMQTVRDVKDVGTATAHASAKAVETTLRAEAEGLKAEARTRELLMMSAREAAECCCEVKEKVAETSAHLREGQLVGFKDAQAVAYRLAAEADKTACSNQMQTLLQFKDQALLTEKLAAAQALLTEKTAAAQALLSEKLACQAAKEAAECCCELKELVRADGQKTRDLINAQEVDRLRERAGRAENSLAAYFAAKSAPVTPHLNTVC